MLLVLAPGWGPRAALCSALPPSAVVTLPRVPLWLGGSPEAPPIPQPLLTAATSDSIKKSFVHQCCASLFLGGSLGLGVPPGFPPPFPVLSPHTLGVSGACGPR